ncbi:bifunctional diguanylate cyclase/phosphodiesterase [Vibrio sp. ABG19]|uniref:putative bifunctional diguanylate cyclase/phosphodiesterase n=1 Tax=Vibrio sp. ABG19 TaxID=2817385 RepID=UPI00249F1BAA|nr:bifunctional diguanylate cyclase/phosphodiesterase [Vibrio sp. ABG19]WGY45428.1 bifunctional diguanylate cyclase/phosphodiesterase [Vibrio sp. ABG19]
MLSATSQTVSRSLLRGVLPLFYLVAVTIVSYSLLVVPQTVAPYLYAYPLCLLLAFISANAKLKMLAALAALGCVTLASQLSPSAALQETFILIPLSYLILFPGTLWPISAALLLVISSLSHHSFNSANFGDYLLDAIELVSISILATLGVHYKHKLQSQIERYRRDSLTDFLTRLANRAAFLNDTKRLESQYNSDQHYALLQLDIDDFKLINDTLGHHQGDILLIGLAQRLNQLNLGCDQLYRLSGDEFALIIKGDQHIRAKADQVAHRILATCSQAFFLNQRYYSMTMSIGVALFDDAMYDSDIWCRNVDIALQRAKQKGKNLVQHFDEELIGETIRNYQLERELSTAISRQQLHLEYQPKVDVVSGRVTSAEALIRWHHPDLGQVNPEQFVAIAEKSQQIIPIGRWVIETACRQAKAWQQQGHDICIAVNVSTVQFLYDDIFQVVSQTLRDTELDARLLQLEITETTLMKQPQSVSQTCEELRRIGVRIAIDDFGIAYSSLNYLKQLPIDVVKIDKSFIDDCVDEHHGHMLVRTIIQLGHNLGKVVTAEGVNSREQLSLLAEEGCDDYQGYYYSPPLIAEEFITLITREQATRTLAMGRN